MPTGHLVWSGVATKHSESLHQAVRAAGFTIKATREEAWWNAGIAYRNKNQSDRLITS
jgi:ribosomal protein L11 methylase PrmA